MVYCDPCDRYFDRYDSYLQHLRNSSLHNYCDPCEIDFDSWYALRQHYIQSPRHFFCRECDTHFEDDEELEEHCIDDHWYCPGCDRFFKNAQGLHEHNRQRHNYCDICRRVFNSENSVRQHMIVHKPKNVPCAFQHRGCTQFFSTKSAMISHLENGRCPSGATREMVDRWVRLNDTGHVITDPRRMITDGQPRRFATELSWNGENYECVLCHNTFRSLADLNKHLASPRHQDKVYHCPLSTCRTRFNTLSGLCQHVESESCGVLRFHIVREGMNQLLENMNRLRIRGPLA